METETGAAKGRIAPQLGKDGTRHQDAGTILADTLWNS